VVNTRLTDLFRMRQFYEAYRDDANISALLRQLPWTHSLIILSQSKRPKVPNKQKAHLEFLSLPYDNSSNTPAMPLNEAHSGGFFSSWIC
jgi:hypothetical protein